MRNKEEFAASKLSLCVSNLFEFYVNQSTIKNITKELSKDKTYMSDC